MAKSLFVDEVLRQRFAKRNIHTGDDAQSSSESESASVSLPCATTVTRQQMLRHSVAGVRVISE